MRATRESLAIDRIEDIAGNPWLVAEYRSTAHGFDLALGWPEGAGRSGMSAAMTASLAEYLIAIERPRDVDLPIGRTTIKRLRSALDLRFDWDAWWAARSVDLGWMTLEAFCRRHHCSTGAACRRRQALTSRETPQ